MEGAAPREYIEFYRLDLSSATRSILIPSGLLIAAGSPFVCVAAARIPLGVDVPRDLVGFFGAGVVLFGLVMGFGGMGRLLVHDGFVGVTRDGIHVRAERRDEFVEWGDVREVRSSVPIELVLTSGRVVSLPKVSATQGADVHARLEDLRRKASLNLLRR